MGNSLDFLSTRVSYKLNLRGPSFTMLSACSTSLLAVTQACQSLLTYQSDMALAGGVSITFPQKRGYYYQDGGMVSPDGHCRAFDADAQGTVFGSGVGVVLLKRARRCDTRRRSDLRGHSRFRRQQRRLRQGRLHGAERGRAGQRHRDGARGRGSRAGIHRLHRSTWNRDAAGRSDRTRRPDPGLSRANEPRSNFARSERRRPMSDIWTSPPA